MTAPTKSRRRAVACCVAAAVACLAATSAHADFRVCNSTESRVGVAIGYKDDGTWMTEGWWNIPANSCETILRGDLNARYYYLHAIDYDNESGEETWDGPVPMCVKDDEFTIRGIENCLTRGFERTGFFEVDTANNRTWEVRLTAGEQSGQSGSAGASQQPVQPDPAHTAATSAGASAGAVPLPPGRPQP